MMTRLLRMVGVGVVLVGTCAVAQVANPDSGGAKRPMTFADMMAMKRVSDPQISPSGKWVMFSVTDVSLEKNTKVNHLWVVPLGGGGERQVTFGAGESGGRFSPDGSQILFISANGGSQQIWLAPWNEAEGALGTGKELTHLSTEADGAIWSPDGKSIAFVSEVYSQCSGWTFDESCNREWLDRDAQSPTKALVFDGLLYRHWDHFQAPRAQMAGPGDQPQGILLETARLSHILMLHVSTPTAIFDLTPPFDWGNDVVAPTFSLDGPIGYAFSPDSKELAFVVNADKEPAASTNNDIYVIDITLHDHGPVNRYGADQGWEPRKISTSPGSDDGPAYSPDGKWLAFRSQARAGYESGRFRLMLFDREKKTTVELLPKPFDRWVDEFSWLPDSQHLLFAEGNEGEEPYGVVSVTEHTPGYYEHRTRLDAKGEFSDIHATSDLTIIATRMTVDHPAEIVALSPQNYDASGNITGSQTIRVLTHLNDTLLAQLDFSTMESYWFAGAGDSKVQGFIIRPPNFDAAKKYPVKFLIHGGPQGAWGDSWSYRWNAELMAASGYVVVMVNPRGSTGYGQAFIDGVNGDWGGKAYVDLMRGLDAAEAKFPFIDKKRECALGGSFGGYMADWVLTHTDRFKCIVTHDGMYDAESAYGSTEEMWFNEWEFRRGPATGAAAWDKEPAQPWRYSSLPADEDPFRKWSPMRYIKNAKTPTLVIHSQKDYRLDVSQGFELFTALQRLGVPSKMLYFPDEGHWVLKPQNSQLWYETVGDWCDRWTKSGK
jgi:dipeptidyl aminopeptidase/acylaminoacyl peptidase